MPEVWTYTRKTFPFRAFVGTFFSALLLINVVNTGYSLAFEDYCKRNSAIYDTQKRNANALKKLIQETNEKEKKTVKGKANTSMSDAEILNEK